MLSLFGQIKVEILDGDLPYLKLNPQRKLSRSTQTVTAKLGDKPYKLRVRAVRRDDDGATWAELLDRGVVREAVARYLEQLECEADSDRRACGRDRVNYLVRSPDLPNYRARTYDLSSSGLRLVTEGPVEVGARLRLQLDDTSATGRSESAVSGVTVWSRKGGGASYHVGVKLTP